MPDKPETTSVPSVPSHRAFNVANRVSCDHATGNAGVAAQETFTIQGRRVQGMSAGSTARGGIRSGGIAGLPTYTYSNWVRLPESNTIFVMLGGAGAPTHFSWWAGLIYLYNSGSNNTSLPKDTLWHHVVGSIEDGATEEVMVWIDGTRRTMSATATGTIGVGELYLATENTTLSRIDWQIADPWLWDRRLSDNEVAQLYRTPGLLWEQQDDLIVDDEVPVPPTSKIFIGSVAVDDLKIGSSDVDAVYIGSNQIWP